MLVVSKIRTVQAMRHVIYTRAIVSLFVEVKHVLKGQHVKALIIEKFAHATLL